jgi:hypothetical protein
MSADQQRNADIRRTTEGVAPERDTPLRSCELFSLSAVLDAQE